MPYTEDAQPNEVRHARKGAAVVPTVRSTHPVPNTSRRGRGYIHHNTHHQRGGSRDAHGFQPGPSRGASPNPRSTWRGAPRNQREQQFRRPSKKPRLEYPKHKDNGVAPGRPPRFRPGSKPGPSTKERQVNASQSGPSKVASSDKVIELSSQDSRSPQLDGDATREAFTAGSSCPDTDSGIDKLPPHASSIPTKEKETPPLSPEVVPLLNSTNGVGLLPLGEVEFSPPQTSSLELPGPRGFRSGKLRFLLPDRRHQLHVSEAFQATSDPLVADSEVPTTDGIADIAAHSDDHIPEVLDSVAVVQMRRETNDKPRRLLLLPHSGALSVTMRGSLDLVEQKPLRCTALRTVSTHMDQAGEGDRFLLDDACLLPRLDGNVVALGRVGDAQQLALVCIKGKTVSEIGTFDRPTQPDKKGGVGAICPMMQPGMLATGGYDHIVHAWTVSEEDGASAVALNIKHRSAVQSLLAIRDTSDKLLSGSADCSVSVYDLSSERVVNHLKLSNYIYHVHRAPSRSCALLEVGHRELQFEVRDLRLVPALSTIRFGYPNAKVHGRYTRGAIQDHIFACGGSERDGCVRLWDLRNAARVLRTVQCFPGRKAIQVAFDNSKMVACSEDHQLAFVQHNTAG